MVNVENLTNIDASERANLIAMFDQLGLPHVISETHFVISSDMQHDIAMIQKIMDDFMLPYIKTNAPDVTAVHVRSDGCKVQSLSAPPISIGYRVSMSRAAGCVSTGPSLSRATGNVTAIPKEGR